MRLVDCYLETKQDGAAVALLQQECTMAYPKKPDQAHLHQRLESFQNTLSE